MITTAPKIIRVDNLTKQEWIDRLTLAQLKIMKMLREKSGGIAFKKRNHSGWYTKNRGVITSTTANVLIAMNVCQIIGIRENLTGLVLTPSGRKVVNLIYGDVR